MLQELLRLGIKFLMEILLYLWYKLSTRFGIDCPFAPLTIYPSIIVYWWFILYPLSLLPSFITTWSLMKFVSPSTILISYDMYRLLSSVNMIVMEFVSYVWYIPVPLYQYAFCISAFLIFILIWRFYFLTFHDLVALMESDMQLCMELEKSKITSIKTYIYIYIYIYI